MKWARGAFAALVLVATMLSVPTLVDSLRRVKWQAITALRQGDAVLKAGTNGEAEPLIRTLLTKTRAGARILVLARVPYERISLDLVYYETYPRLLDLYPDQNVALAMVPGEWIRIHKIDWFLEIGAGGITDFSLTPATLDRSVGAPGRGLHSLEAIGSDEPWIGAESLTNVALAALAIIAIELIGYAVFLVLYRRARPLAGGEALGLAFGLGIGVVTFGMFYLSYCHVRLTPRRVTFFLTVLVTVSAFFVARSRRGGPHQSPGLAIGRRFRDCSRMDRLLLLVLCGLFLFVVADALSSPLLSFDSRTNFAVKAKQILYNEGIYSQDTYGPELADGHRRYPLLIPLAEALVCQMSGRYAERGMKLLFPAFYLSLLALLYAAVRPFASRSFALSAVALFGALPALIGMADGGAASGYADLPLAYFVAALGVYLLRYLQIGHPRDLVVASLMAAFAAFTKGEGATLAAIGFLTLAGALAPWRTTLRRTVPVAFAGLGVFVALLPWLHYRSLLPTHLVGTPNEDLLELVFSANAKVAARRLPLIIRSFAGQFLLRADLWGALWWCSLAALLFPKARGVHGPARHGFLLTFAVLYLGTVGVAYTVTQWDVGRLIPVSLPRLLMHVAPLVLVWVSAEARYTGLLPVWVTDAETLESVRAADA
jgi:hypothetical protein